MRKIEFFNTIDVERTLRIAGGSSLMTGFRTYGRLAESAANFFFVSTGELASGHMIGGGAAPAAVRNFVPDRWKNGAPDRMKLGGTPMKGRVLHLIG
jgi:hypothetical protein